MRKKAEAERGSDGGRKGPPPVGGSDDRFFERLLLAMI